MTPEEKQKIISMIKRLTDKSYMRDAFIREINAMPEESEPCLVCGIALSSLDRTKLENEITKRKYKEWMNDEKCHDPYTMSGGQGAYISFLDWLDKGGE